MAKIQFSAIVGDARGKFGNAIFSRNRSANYIREFERPTNPRTAAQQAVRTAFGLAASAWRTLTQSQREGWNGLVEEYRQSNVFGQNVRLSGFQIFMKVNALMAQLGTGIITYAVPNSQVIPNSWGVVGFNEAYDGQIESLATNVDAGSGEVLIYGTRMLSPGQQRVFDNDFKLIGNTAVPATPGSVTVPALASFVASLDPEDQASTGHFFLRFVTINANSGKPSAPLDVQVRGVNYVGGPSALMATMARGSAEPAQVKAKARTTKPAANDQ